MRRESVSTNPASWRKFLAVHSLASIAEGLSLTYLPIVVLAATGSTALTSLVVFLRTLPVLIGVIPAGSLADSGRRARTMQMGNSVGVLGATLLSVEAFLGTESSASAMLIIATVLLGTAQAFHTGVANTVPVLLLKESERPRGISQVMLLGTVLGFVIGPALGGVAGQVDPAIASTVLVVVYVLLVVLSSMLGLEETVTERVWSQMGQKFSGLVDAGRALFSSTVLSIIALVSVAQNVAYGLMISVLPVYIVDTLGQPAGLFGIIVASGSVGGLIGSLVAPHLISKIGWRPVLAASSVGAAAGYCLIGFVPVVAGLLAGYVFGSLAMMVWSIVSGTLRQHLIPVELFGRSVGLYTIMVIGATPAGALVASTLSAMGPSPSLVLAAILVALSAAATVLLLR